MKQQPWSQGPCHVWKSGWGHKVLGGSLIHRWVMVSYGSHRNKDPGRKREHLVKVRESRAQLNGLYFRAECQ